jgi:hypothetical protein
VGDAVGRREIVRLAHPDAEAVNPVAAGPDEDGALLPDEPVAEPPALEQQSGLGEQLTALMAEQIAEQPERGAFRRFRRLTDRLHPPRTAPRLHVQDRETMSEEDHSRGCGERLDPDQQRGGQAEGDQDPDAPQRPDPALGAKRPLARPTPPRHRRGLSENR